MCLGRKGLPVSPTGGLNLPLPNPSVYSHFIKIPVFNCDLSSPFSPCLFPGWSLVSLGSSGGRRGLGRAGGC